MRSCSWQENHLASPRILIDRVLDLVGGRAWPGPCKFLFASWGIAWELLFVPLSGACSALGSLSCHYQKLGAKVDFGD